MIQRLQRRIPTAPHSRDKQHRYGNYHLIELHHVTKIYPIVTAPLGAVWNVQVVHG